MTGTLTFAGCTWPLQDSSLDSMRNAAQEPWQESIVEFLDRWWSDDERIRVNTSGSTGDPRPLWHAKANLVESARRTIQHFGLMPGTHAGLAMPVQFIGGMMMVVRAEVGGWNLTAVQPQAAPEFGAALDFVALTPPQAQAWQRTHPRVVELQDLARGRRTGTGGLVGSSPRRTCGVRRVRHDGDD